MLLDVLQRDRLLPSRNPDVVVWPVARVAAEASHDGGVHDGARRDVAGAAGVEGEADVLPFAVLVLPSFCDGEVFCGRSLLVIRRFGIKRVEMRRRHGSTRGVLIHVEETGSDSGKLRDRARAY